MPTVGELSTSPRAAARSRLTWVLIPAVVMSLGWGLRGYIGGGTYGAMIPGALVAICLCQYLGYSVQASAVVAAFGAIGIGFGGAMTYGQTLGLLRESETFYWGLTGTTLKGAVWGLLGGAVLGLGLAVRHIAPRNLVGALVCLLIAVVVGIHFINEPKLIYFSDPVNKPREESWAGLLFGGLALLAYLRIFEAKLFFIPAGFAAYGAVGGAIGFGGGSLLLAMQSRVDEAWRWMPYWKYMEFTFGFVFGASLGLCALHLSDRLPPLATGDGRQGRVETAISRRRHVLPWMASLIVGAAVVLGVFYGWPSMAYRMLPRMYPSMLDLPRGSLSRSVIGVLFGFTGIGCVLMLLSRRSSTVAWQTAISVTIMAAAIDWNRNLLSHGNIEMPVLYRRMFMFGVAAISILFVHAWQHRKVPRLMHVFLFAACVLMGFGYLKGLSRSEIWWADAALVSAAGGHSAYLWKTFDSEIIVHLIFTALFAVTIWAALREPSDESHVGH